MQQLTRLQQALDRLRGDPEVQRELGALLEPLRRYDEAHGSDLVLTLTALLHEGGNVIATAERLFLHRNSVLYRLHRIEELTGLEVRERQVRETLQKAYHLAHQPNSTPESQRGEP